MRSPNLAQNIFQDFPNDKLSAVTPSGPRFAGLRLKSAAGSETSSDGTQPLSRAHPDREIIGRGPPARSGLRLRIAATAGMVALAGLSAARHASASFDEPHIPIGDVASSDGIVSGTVRLTGNRLVFFAEIVSAPTKATLP